MLQEHEQQPRGRPEQCRSLPGGPLRTMTEDEDWMVGNAIRNARYGKNGGKQVVCMTN
jgi:hypothetical protein